MMKDWVLQAFVSDFNFVSCSFLLVCSVAGFDVIYID